MTKTLILKGRNPDTRGVPTWHDKAVLINALNAISKGKSLEKLASWISIAGKIERAAIEEKFGELDDNNKPWAPELKVKVKNTEARLFWRELKSLSLEKFGGVIPCRKCGVDDSNVPGLGTLVIMLQEVATCLGETFPLTDDDEDEKELVENS